MIDNDTDLLVAQARLQTIQALLAHSRQASDPDDYRAQSKGWLKEWDRLQAEIREYLATPAIEPEVLTAAAA